MKILTIRRSLSAAFALSLVLGLILLSCDIQNPAEDFNLILDVEVNKEIYTGQISAEPTVLHLAQNTIITAPGMSGVYLAKSTVTDFIEVPIIIPNMATFLAILNDETAPGGNFVGTLTNRATNPVTFGIYFSNTTGIADPWTDPASNFIASVTLTAAPSATVPANPVYINGPEDFDNPTNPEDVKDNMINYVQGAILTNPSDPIITYLTSKTPGDSVTEEIDVLVEDMSLYLPAEVEIWNTVTPGDLDNYSNKIEEITSAQMNGTITNTGTVGIRFIAYIYLETETFDPVYHLVAKTTIDAGATLVFEDYPDMFDPGNPALTPPKLSGEQLLLNGIASLQAGNNLTIYLHFYSLDAAVPISATIDGIELESNVKIIE